MNIDYIVSLLITAAALILAITIHESAHAFVAYLLGDKTARSRGRVSLNPLNHNRPLRHGHPGRCSCSQRAGRCSHSPNRCRST